MSFSVRSRDTGHVETKSRRLRHRDVRRKLSSILFESIARTPGVAVIGTDPLVNYFATTAGLEATSLATCQAFLDDVGPVTIIGVPTRLWYRREAMDRLHRLKAYMESCGRSCFLIPQPAVVMLDRDDDETPSGKRVEVLIELIRNPAGMGVDHPCCRHGLGDPIGCRAMRLLTGADCRA